MNRTINEQEAAAVLAILKEECGWVDPYDGRGFCRAILAPHPADKRICQEYRFMGALGFGGKFRNNGNNNNTPYVDCYPEHRTPKIDAMIARANERLAALFPANQN